MSYPFLENLIADLTSFDPGTRLIPTFGLLVAIAIIYSLSRAKHLYSQVESDSSAKEFETCVYIGVFFGLLGAKVFHAIEFLEYGFWNQVLSRSGFSIYGGMVFGVIAGVVMLRIKSLNVLNSLDIASPFLALGYAIGRIGCQLSGDGDWGKAADMTNAPDWLPTWLWAQTYENNIAGVVINAPGVYPTPLYETILAGLTFLFLRKFYSNMRDYAGALFAVYLILSGFARFIVELIRINPLYTDLAWSQAQFIAALCIVAGIVGLALSLTRRTSDRASNA